MTRALALLALLLLSSACSIAWTRLPALEASGERVYLLRVQLGSAAMREYAE